MKLIARCRIDLRHEHGWNVKLTCPDCSHKGVPRFDGWAANTAINFGNAPTLFARLACANCGGDLRSAASESLQNMFSGVRVSKRNVRLIVWFVGTIVLVVTLPIAAQLIFNPRVSVAWLGGVLGPLVGLAFNRRVASIRTQCRCGHPRYIFMGMLGRSSCYRCSTCANLLRLRD